MLRTVSLSRLGLVLVAAFMAGCATAGAGAGEGAGAATDAVMLRVHNTDTSGESLTIFLVPQTGELVRLGRVAPNEFLTVEYPGGQARVQLRAERPNGTTVTSPAFNVVSGTYTWDMALRRVERSR
jgi:hypothetical protein